MEWRPTTCQWIGPDQDPLTDWPIKYCGDKLMPGKSYCREHYHKMYISGSAISGKRKQKQLEAEIKELELQQLIAEQEKDLEESNV